MILDQNRKEGTEHSPFVSFPSPERSPERLWWWGRVRGVDCEPPDRARVLDVGCSSGDLLLATAELYPFGEYVGVDLDGHAIQRAEELQEQSGIQNIRFLHGRIEDEAAQLGKFDYIICHGVYTWIPHHSREAFLSALERCLAPKGILYLSHNTLPGWSVRESLLRLLRPSIRDGQSGSAEIERAKDVLRHLQHVLVDAHRPYGMRLREEIERNLERSDMFFLKELLAPDTHGLWLSEVIGEAAELGLFYISDAHPTRNQWMNPDPVFRSDLFANTAPFQGLSEAERASLSDIVYPASFRGSLFIRESSQLRGVGDDGIDVTGLLPGTFVASPLVCDEESQIILKGGDTSTQMVPFYGPTDQVVEVKAPAVKYALCHLAQVWPAAVAFDELCSNLQTQGLLVDGEQESFERSLVGLTFRNLLDVYPAALKVQTEAEERPYIPKFRRLRASQGWTLTLRSELFKTDDLDRVLLPLLDGTRSIRECVSQVEHEVSTGRLRMVVDGASLDIKASGGFEGEGLPHPELTEVVRERIAWYREQALFAIQG